MAARRPDQPCPCHACTVAGCDRPPVTLAGTRWQPQRELHGRELRRHYERVDARRAMWAQVVERLRDYGGGAD